MFSSRDREIYLFPLSKIRDVLKENRRKRAKFFDKFPELNAPLSKDFIVGSGHQPYFFHPGIWVKCFLLEELNSTYETVFLTHDADTTQGFFCDIPVKNTRWRKTREYLILNPEEISYEALKKEDFIDKIPYFKKEIERVLYAKPLSFLKDRIFEYINALESELKKGKKPVSAIVEARRKREGKPGYREILVSEESKSINFYKFFLLLFYNAEDVFTVFNRVLKEYREENNIRNPAEPFPPLGEEENLIELPFWLNREFRIPLFKHKGKGSLWTSKEKLLSLSGRMEKDVELIREINIRPRAFTLSLFQRLFMCDIFFHGLGGERYDKITDRFAKEFFNFDMPQGGVITGTFYLFKDTGEDKAGLLSQLKEKRNFIYYHPERFLSDHPLGQKKKELVKKIQESKGKQKKEITIKLKRVNSKLRNLISSELEKINEEITRVEDEISEQEVLRFREYPFFYFDGEEIKEALKGKLKEIESENQTKA